MIEEIVNYIGSFFIILGSFFILTGSLGVLRMPDFFSRTHPAGITDSLGAPLVLFGILLNYGLSLIAGKVFLLIIFLYLTNPTASHIVAKAAIIKGKKPLGKEM